MLEPPWRTADWAYVRWHEGDADPRPCYPREDLEAWVQRLTATGTPDEDVYAFFNNDPGGCAITDARVLRELWPRES
jgi:uncharacterized protein YecE (DUF72 family)